MNLLQIGKEEDKMNKINYQKELDKILDKIKDTKPTLLLHSCCAPCSSYVLEYLSQYFDITIDYYNPNIDSKEEECMNSNVWSKK